jgi:hypothetical protein
MDEVKSEATVEKPKLGRPEKTAEDKLRDDHRPIANVVRDFTQPDILKVPKPNPRIHYRWGRNTDDNLATLEAQGFRVANSDEVRECGFRPAADGAAHRGDLILCVEDWGYYKAKQERKEALIRRQAELQHKGSTKGISARVSGKDWGFQETIKEG